MPRKLKDWTYDPVEHTARKLARKILKEDYTKLFKKKKFLIFNIKIAKINGNGFRIKRIYMFKNFKIYLYIGRNTVKNKRQFTIKKSAQESFTRICSLIAQPSKPITYTYSDIDPYRGTNPRDPYGQNYSWERTIEYNRYDTLVAQYLWFKLYSKSPCSEYVFKTSFNVLNHDKYSLKQILDDCKKTI